MLKINTVNVKNKLLLAANKRTSKMLNIWKTNQKQIDKYSKSGFNTVVHCSMQCMQPLSLLRRKRAPAIIIKPSSAFLRAVRRLRNRERVSLASELHLPDDL